MPYVILQKDGAPKPFAEWFVPVDGSQEADRDEERKWATICGRLLREAVKRKTMSLFNVFLLFDRKELLEERDRPALCALIKRARERCWGARFLLALRGAPLISRIPTPARADIVAWMDEVLAGRISDVVQIAAAYDSGRPNVLHQVLRDHASEVVKRQKIFRERVGERPWRSALPRNWVELAAFLGSSLAITEPTDDLTFDLVIVLQNLSVREQQLEIERHLAKDPARRRRYRVLTYMHEPDRLRRFCEERDLGQPVAIGGDFELWYLLLRLNEHAQSQRSAGLDSIHPVELAKAPRLSVSNPSPIVLLTSVFDPSEKLQWFEAATDVGRFLHLFPLAMEYRVELATGPERLTEILGQNDMPPVHTWIHMGHGSGKQGLWVPGEGDVPPERWVRCFHERRLRLALFLTCDSHEIARHFAEQGTTVAIGFEGEVESDKARQLAIGILQTMLTDGGGGGSGDGGESGPILAGFRYGAARFESAQTLTARPRAYYPRRV